MLFRSLILALATGTIFAIVPARGQDANSRSCVTRAVEVLRASSKTGHQVWNQARGTSAAGIFEAFLECTTRQSIVDSLPTAVHEAVHGLRGNGEKYLLVSGRYIDAIDDQGYFAPKLISGLLTKINVPRENIYYTTYLATAADASAKDYFSYLLDEFNAYTNDLQVSVELDGARVQTLRSLTGVPAFMSFVSLYLELAESEQTATWTRIRSDAKALTAIRSLWEQAESTLALACRKPLPEFDPDDLVFMSQMCNGKYVWGITSILGRKPRCFQKCGQ